MIFSRKEKKSNKVIYFKNARFLYDIFSFDCWLQWLLAAAVHGGLAVQLKLYPVIFLPAFYLHIVRERANEHPIHILFPRCVQNEKPVSDPILSSRKKQKETNRKRLNCLREDHEFEVPLRSVLWEIVLPNNMKTLFV